MIVRGDSLELLMAETVEPDLIVTDPPYAFGGIGDEHELSATVAIVLREAAQRLKKGRWMLVMCASSWRSTQLHGRRPARCRRPRSYRDLVQASGPHQSSDRGLALG